MQFMQMIQTNSSEKFSVGYQKFYITVKVRKFIIIILIVIVILENAGRGIGELIYNIYHSPCLL